MRETELLTCQVEVCIGKCTFMDFVHSRNPEYGGKEKPLYPFLVSYDASFPSFDRSSDGTSPSEEDIKVLFRAPTF